ncbi:MAG: RNA polymerase sigma factor [Planctomycetota bacterium]|jgi:RNA polymerase sigma-70 factor (ECF subfamily)
MLEDKILLLRFKHGRSQALEQIYQKYKVELLSLATAMTGDRDLAEDVLHDVFVSFARSAKGLQLRTSLRRYLTTAVANRVRNIRRKEHRVTRDFGTFEQITADNDMRPEHMAMTAEEFEYIRRALGQLPQLQREAVTLRLHSGVPFKVIARLQDVTVSTVQARYRYGLNKLRSLLDGEAKE